MLDLRHQLLAFRHQPTLWVGVGNDSLGDDAAGLDLAQKLTESGIPHVLNAGTNPDRWIATAQLDSFMHVVFLDAVELGAQPGSVVFLTADEITARFPQVSTHKISLGLLARCVQSQSAARAWLLGIQPQSLRHGRGPDIGGEPPDLDLTLELLPSTLDVGRWTLDVHPSAFSNWPSTPDDPEPLRRTPSMTAPSLPSPHSLRKLSRRQDGESAGLPTAAPVVAETTGLANHKFPIPNSQFPIGLCPLSVPVQRTIQILHQLITESFSSDCSDESAEPATFDPAATLPALPR